MVCGSKLTPRPKYWGRLPFPKVDHLNSWLKASTFRPASTEGWGMRIERCFYFGPMLILSWWSLGRIIQKWSSKNLRYVRDIALICIDVIQSMGFIVNILAQPPSTRRVRFKEFDPVLMRVVTQRHTQQKLPWPIGWSGCFFPQPIHFKNIHQSMVNV